MQVSKPRPAGNSLEYYEVGLGRDRSIGSGYVSSCGRINNDAQPMCTTHARNPNSFRLQPTQQISRRRRHKYCSQMWMGEITRISLRPDEQSSVATCACGEIQEDRLTVSRGLHKRLGNRKMEALSLSWSEGEASLSEMSPA